jgi:hypothetical protein
MPAERGKTDLGASTTDPPRGPKPKAASPVGGERAEAAVADVSEEKLVRLFSQPRATKQFLAGIRVLGFTADAVMEMTAAKSRDVVYSWAAGRARPGKNQAERLDDVRRALYFICRHRELGAESAWMLFNARFGDMKEEGPTMMDLIAEGKIARVMKNLEELVDDQGGGDGGGGGPGPTDDQPQDPSPPDDSLPIPTLVDERS